MKLEMKDETEVFIRICTWVNRTVYEWVIMNGSSKNDTFQNIQRVDIQDVDVFVLFTKRDLERFSIITLAH